MTRERERERKTEREREREREKENIGLLLGVKVLASEFPPSPSLEGSHFYFMNLPKAKGIFPLTWYINQRRVFLLTCEGSC